jgi:NAD+ synthase (glutamine-hydrolysing)
VEKIRIALAQINPTVGDLRGNIEKIRSFIIQAQELKADIITFPELAVCGYPPEDLLLKKHFVRDNLKVLDSLVEKIYSIIVIVGFVDMDPVRNFAKAGRKIGISNGVDKKGNLYNAAGIIHNGKLRGVYHKIELPNYGVFDEKRYFQQGNKSLVFNAGKITFGVNICEDIWKINGVAKLQADKGAQLIINISASPYYVGKGNLRRRVLVDRAKETKSYICYNNLVGGQDELVFDGGSMILGPKGEEIACGKQFEEDLIVADLSIKIPKSKPHPSSDAMFYLREKGGKIGYKSYVKLGVLKDTEKPDLPKKKKYKKLNRISEIYSALVLGTRDYIRKNGFQNAVIGLSGGIDSSLTAVIACDAIGKENVIGISMPSRYSSQQTQSDAKILASNLGIKFIVVPISSIFAVYLNLLDKEFVGLKRNVAEENLQARIRGNILMAFSNKFGWLVLTTGNKSETSVGYCTLYGDTAGGFAVIKDVPKTLVYELARFRNEREGGRLIPESVFNREPSAELKPDQKDQDTLPPYSVLDSILKAYIEEDKSFEQIVAKKFKSEIVKSVIQMVDSNEYKRRQAPPGVKITPKAFGRDRRFPITNRYRED